ncbi:hypothetical protein IWQ61_003623 [Dispira simplex]|nr:hypothetical protein IWQ61_003623 [Dispira simplex]
MKRNFSNTIDAMVLSLELKYIYLAASASQAKPEEDPLDQCWGHGTHVAGTTPGIDRGFKAVAYEATLGIYRIFSCKQTTSTSVALEAFRRALASGMRILNLPFGSLTEFLTDVLSEAAENLYNKDFLTTAIPTLATTPAPDGYSKSIERSSSGYRASKYDGYLRWL